MDQALPHQIYIGVNTGSIDAILMPANSPDFAFVHLLQGLQPDNADEGRLVTLARQLYDKNTSDYAMMQLRLAAANNFRGCTDLEIADLAYFMKEDLFPNLPANLKDEIAARQLNDVQQALDAYQKGIDDEFKEYKQTYVPAVSFAGLLMGLGIIKDKKKGAKLAQVTRKVGTGGLAALAGLISVYFAGSYASLTSYDGNNNADNHATVVVVDQNGNYAGLLSTDEQPKVEAMQTTYKTNAEIGEIVKKNLQRIANSGSDTRNIEAYIVVVDNNSNLAQIVRERTKDDKVITLIAPLVYKSKQVKSSDHLGQGVIAYDIKSITTRNAETSANTASPQETTDEYKLNAYEAMQEAKRGVEEKQRAVGEKAVGLGVPIVSTLAETGMTGLAIAEDVGTVVACAEALPLCGYVIAERITSFNGDSEDVPFTGTLEKSRNTLDSIVTTAKDIPENLGEFLGAMQKLSEASKNYSDKVTAYSKMIDPNKTQQTTNECIIQNRGAAFSSSPEVISQVIIDCLAKSEVARNEDARVKDLYDRVQKTGGIDSYRESLKSHAETGRITNRDAISAGGKIYVSDTEVHVVQKGETLTSIGKGYGMSAEQLQAKNNAVVNEKLQAKLKAEEQKKQESQERQRKDEEAKQQAAREAQEKADRDRQAKEAADRAFNHIERMQRESASSEPKDDLDRVFDRVQREQREQASSDD
ncbi:LysM peptidoglycan-binding domain-containing protein [Candidatus Woesearchaeota archaeon]|nr:LysM peptidoglycan-binding domain-containing protein [Candidatus Woesearchaeota archaeon]